MSTILLYDNKIYSFRDFLLSEAIKPKKVSYGLNSPLFDDYKVDNNILSTCFKHPKDYEGILVAILESGECSFGLFPITKTNNIFDRINLLSDKRKYNSPGLKIFNSVFYVLLELIKYSNIKRIWFNAANKDLSIMYSIIVKNKFFLQELNNIGFHYHYDNNHIFTKKG